jgi:hypothetical protein
MLKKLSTEISKYFFLVLFIGFFGSITIFSHTHVVNGVTIVHSHPFKSDNKGNPLHSHSDKGYITIQLLSSFIFSSTLIYYTFGELAGVINKLSIRLKEQQVNDLYHYCYSLRAPPADMLK